MKKFNSLKSIPAYLPIVNIDTDMIIPKQFLKTIKRTGLGKNLFFEIRYDNDGKEIKFEIDSFKKKCLLEGLDDIALSLEKEEKISSFEKSLKNQKPWVFND